MGIISAYLSSNLEKGSWIRKLFDEGRKLKEVYGEQAVFDFSLGNPCIEPPQEFVQALNLVTQEEVEGKHRYIENQGLYPARQKVAEFLTGRFAVNFTPEAVVMTVGAGGALNIVFKSILDDGDEVILLTPYFVEYHYYVENSSGKVVLCPLADDFSIDIERVSQAITAKTKAILVNTPHNPTGTVLTQDNLNKLGDLLKETEIKFNNKIFLVYDDPYGQLVYDVIPPNPFIAYHRTVLASSFSKDLGIAGERLGYIATEDNMEAGKLLTAAFTFSLRTLGFVNAPVLMQRVIAKMNSLKVTAEEYKKRRDLMVSILKEAGYEFETPQGGFFIFPKTPIADDVEFCLTAAEKLKLLIVPGSGFGRKGHFRLSFSVPIDQIERSKEAFKQALLLYKK